MKKILLFIITIFSFSINVFTQKHFENIYTYNTSLSKSAKNAKINYHLAMPEPHTHYYEVELEITDFKKDYIDFKLPVWAPGSYLIREFPRFVEAFSASSNEEEVKWELISKNTWRVFSNKKSNIKIKYKVYAYELSVRTSFLDASHAYFNGTSIFMYVDELIQKNGELKITPFKEFKKIATGLETINGDKWHYQFPSYDILVDCPFEIGNHNEFEFDVKGIKHKVAMYGEGNYDIPTLKNDMRKICESATDVFGVNPNEHYTFIIHNISNPSGGLEHLNSTTLMVNRWTYSGKDYIGFLSLVAHEYFHLWNVKRVRPIKLGPFDYEQENYTNLLWVMEGFTSYYDELLLYRSGFMTEEEMLIKIRSGVNYDKNAHGSKVQSVAEASFNAWIKSYRPHENSRNTTISYYSKGSIMAAMLDVQIVSSTNGEKHLDDLLKYLYNEYFINKKRGFTDEEFQKAAEKIAGVSLDGFFKDHIYNVKSIDYNKWFNNVGVNYTEIEPDQSIVSLGTRMSGNVIKGVDRESSSYIGGLNVNDEILAVDNYRVKGNNLSLLLNQHKIGDKIEVLISRDNIIETIEITLLPKTQKTYLISKREKQSEEEKKKFDKWFYKN